MAQKRTLKTIKRKVAKFGGLLKKHGYNDAGLILFGSWAKGKEQEWSDIDVCVISEKLGTDLFEEKRKLSKIASDIDILIEPIPMSREDLEDKYSTLAYEIKKYGIRID